MGAQDWHLDLESNRSGNFVNVQHRTCGARTRFDLDKAVPGTTHYCSCGKGVLLSAQSLAALRQMMEQAKRQLGR
jgi:hypothetical protein